MNPIELLALYDRCQRVEIKYPDARKDVFPDLIRFVRPAPRSSFISYSKLDPREADAQLEQYLAYFIANGLPVSWKVYEHDTPPDLKERLTARGGKLYEQEDVMVLDLTQAPASLLKTPQELIDPTAQAEIRAITRIDQLGEVKQVLSQVWGGDFAWIDSWLGTCLETPGFANIYAAYAAGEPVSVGWVLFHPDNPFANLYGGSTVPEQRGRGLYTALLAVRTQEALRRGCRYLTIEAGEMSGPIVQRHGFETLVRAWEVDWEIPRVSS